MQALYPAYIQQGTTGDSSAHVHKVIKSVNNIYLYIFMNIFFLKSISSSKIKYVRPILLTALKSNITFTDQQSDSTSLVSHLSTSLTWRIQTHTEECERKQSRMGGNAEVPSWQWLSVPPFDSIRRKDFKNPVGFNISVCA